MLQLFHFNWDTGQVEIRKVGLLTLIPFKIFKSKTEFGFFFMFFLFVLYCFSFSISKNDVVITKENYYL